MSERLSLFLQRRRFLVNRRLQLTLLRRSMVAGLVGFLIVACALVVPLLVELQSVSAQPSTQSGAAELLLFLHDRFFFVAVLTAIAVVLWSLRSSHHVAGPLMQMMRAVRRVRDGEAPGAVRIRSDDLLSEEVAELNAMLHRLRQTSDELHAGRDALRRAASACSERTEELDAAIERMSAAVERLGRTTPPDSPLPAVAGAPRVEGGGCVPATTSRRSPEDGFTMVELMVVLIVIAVIVAIVVPLYIGAVENARIVKAIGGVRAIAIEIDEYRNQHGELPTELDDRWIDPWGNPYVYDPFTLTETEEARVELPEIPVITTSSAHTPLKRRKKRKRKKGKKSAKGGSDTVSEQASGGGDSGTGGSAESGVSGSDSDSGGEGTSDPVVNVGATSDDDTDLDLAEEAAPDLNSDYDLFSMGPDGRTSSEDDDESGDDDIVRADNGMYFGLYRQY